VRGKRGEGFRPRCEMVALPLHIGNFCFWCRFLILIFQKPYTNFVEILNLYVNQMVIKAATRIINSDEFSRSDDDLYLGVTFWNTGYVELCSST